MQIKKWVFYRVQRTALIFFLFLKLKPTPIVSERVDKFIVTTYLQWN